MRVIIIEKIEYSFVFKLSAIRLYEQVTGDKFEDSLQDLGLSKVCALAWAGLKEGCGRDGIEFNLTLEDIEYTIGDDPELISTITGYLKHDIEQFAKGIGTKKKLKG